jgi:hypothetical protein
MVANAQDIVVNGSGLPGTYNTISAAVDAASPGDKILVSNQAFPYQEDTLFINKDVTIMPYSEINSIGFDGDILVTLDSIASLTLIGFNSPATDVLTLFNDTTRNSLSTINITDCHFNTVDIAQPKTSLYLSYSTAYHVYFSHGDIIGNKIQGQLGFGLMDWGETYDEYGYSNKKSDFFTDNENSLGAYYSKVGQCELFELNLSFGDLQVHSDTCNIIANDFGPNSASRVVMFSTDFAFNIRNNKFAQGSQNGRAIKIYRCCSTAKGDNDIVNNNLSPANTESGGYTDYYGVRLCFAYCGGSHNFSDVNLNILNNNCYYALRQDIPSQVQTSTFENYNLSFEGLGISAYNLNNGYSDFNSPWFSNGPENDDGNNPNPSQEFLDLDLTPNTKGVNGGSDAWSNYHSGSEAGFGTLTGSKARITYLNLPTQIFDPSNITIKARAVHGN